MSPTKDQVNAVLSEVARRAPYVADYLGQNKAYWAKYVKATWEARTVAPKDIVSLRGRPPTTLPSMLSNVQALRLAVSRGTLPVDAALLKRLDKLGEVTLGMWDQDPKKATQVLSIFTDIRNMTPGERKRGQVTVPAEVASAPSAVSRLFDLATQMGA